MFIDGLFPDTPPLPRRHACYVTLNINTIIHAPHTTGLPVTTASNAGGDTGSAAPPVWHELRTSTTARAPTTTARPTLCTDTKLHYASTSTPRLHTTRRVSGRQRGPTWPCEPTRQVHEQGAVSPQQTNMLARSRLLDAAVHKAWPLPATRPHRNTSAKLQRHATTPSPPRRPPRRSAVTH